MDTAKKILKWIAIALAIVFGIILILIACMYFFPSFNLFGYRFVRQNTAVEQGHEIAILPDTTYYLIITTDNFDIEINESLTTDRVQISYIDKKWGFANVMDSKVFVNAKDNNISIKTLETSGLVFGTGKITITTPVSLVPHINITTKSGDIHLDKMNVLSITTSMDSGKFSWVAHTYTIDEDATSGTTATASEGEENNTDENINNEATDTTINPEDIITTSVNAIEAGSISIFCKGAEIDLSALSDIHLTGRMYIDADHLSLKLTKLTANLYIHCNTLNLDIMELQDSGKMQLYCVNGSINIDTLVCIDKSMILTDSAKVYIRDCNSAMDISSKGGNVQLSNIHHTTTISTTSGAITIAKATADIILATNTGNVNIAEYTCSADIMTITGNISINNVGEVNPNHTTTITQESGYIDATTHANGIKINSERGSNINFVVRSTPQNDNIKHEIFNIFGETNVAILMTSNPFRVRAVGRVSGELATNVIMSSNTNYVNITPPGYVGEVLEQTHMNMEGGIIVFEGLYE